MVEKDKAIGSRLIETERLIEQLSELHPGEMVTYEQLSETIGENILQRRYLLESAKAAVERDTSLRFENIRNVGVRCCVALGKVNGTLKQTIKSRRAAGRGLNIYSGITTADRQELSETDRLKADTAGAILLAIQEQTSLKTQKRMMGGERLSFDLTILPVS